MRSTPVIVENRDNWFDSRFWNLLVSQFASHEGRRGCLDIFVLGE
jgi:hypothetical protein